MKIDRSILPPGKIGLAVSGGSDSVALAFLLTKGGKKKNAAKRFVVLHVDHGLRKESKEEYRFVRSLARRLGIPFKGIHAKVVKRRGESLEMAARRVRLAFFATFKNQNQKYFPVECMVLKKKALGAVEFHQDLV